MIEPRSYYIVHGWMMTELGLRGNELTMYAIIYGFSQDGHSEFSGSISYIMEWLGCSRPTAIKTLANLVERGLIVKSSTNNGVECNTYRAVLDLPKNDGVLPGGSKENLPVIGKKTLPVSGKKTLPGVVKNLNLGSQNSLPNKDIYKDIYTDISDAGVTPATPAAHQKKEKPVRHQYGIYKNVLLSDADYDKVKAEFPADYAARIDRLSEYMKSTGKRYADHLATIRSWARKDGTKRAESPAPVAVGNDQQLDPLVLASIQRAKERRTEVPD